MAANAAASTARWIRSSVFHLIARQDLQDYTDFSQFPERN